MNIERALNSSGVLRTARVKVKPARFTTVGEERRHQGILDK